MSMDDIAKIPRLPGDGAQDDPNSKFVESSNTQQISSDAEYTITQSNISGSENPINKGK